MAGLFPPRTSGALLRLWAVVALLTTAMPSTASAQTDAFVDAFVALHSALAGTHGDEGPETGLDVGQKEAEPVEAAQAARRRRHLLGGAHRRRRHDAAVNSSACEQARGERW